MSFSEDAERRPHCYLSITSSKRRLKNRLVKVHGHDVSVWIITIVLITFESHICGIITDCVWPPGVHLWLYSDPPLSRVLAKRQCYAANDVYFPCLYNSDTTKEIFRLVKWYWNIKRYAWIWSKNLSRDKARKIQATV